MVGHIELIPLFLAALVLSGVVYDFRKPSFPWPVFLATVLFGALIAGIGREISFGRIYGADLEQEFWITLGFALLFAPLLAVRTVLAAIALVRGRAGRLVSWTSREMQTFAVAVVVFFIGDWFEGAHFIAPYHAYLEESFEMAAYLLLLVVALGIRRNIVALKTGAGPDGSTTR
ncbi:hypothetical protein [Nioella sp.]|uniref:hypothetical protein n=1 Tax=Nioella sp. TaxID=1912091 RepID=UPI003A8C30E2